MRSNQWWYLAASLSLGMLLAACGPTSQVGPTGPAEPPTQPAASPTPAGGELDSPLPTATPAGNTGPTPAATPVPDDGGGEVPAALLASIVQDLAGRLGVEPGQIQVERAESVVWNDGSLGCPEPGMMYTQAVVDGYWVVLQAGGQSYDYRATDRGFFRLCENPSPVNPGTD